MKKIFIIFIASLFLFSLISAQESGGILTGKQNNEIQLPQECASCSYVNITSIQYPDMSREFINTEMTKQGTSFNYTFSSTGQLGIYTYCFLGDVDGVDTVGCKDFEITPSGSILSQAGSITLFGSLLVMIILSSVFLYIASKTENITGRVALYSTAFIGYIMSILYTVITVQQILFGFDSIINGFETFLFVGKIGIWIGFIILMVVVFLIMLKAWKIKRGFYD